MMILGYIIHLFVCLYGGEEHTQNNPLGFMAFFCAGIAVPIIGIVAILS